MASCFFIMKQFDDVLLYLSSIKSYFYNDDTFNFDYGQAKAATANYREAEETFALIQSEKIKSDFVYISWLTRCCKYISYLYFSQTIFHTLDTECFCTEGLCERDYVKDKKKSTHSLFKYSNWQFLVFFSSCWVSPLLVFYRIRFQLQHITSFLTVSVFHFFCWLYMVYASW